MIKLAKIEQLNKQYKKIVQKEIKKEAWVNFAINAGLTLVSLIAPTLISELLYNVKSVQDGFEQVRTSFIDYKNRYKDDEKVKPILNKIDFVIDKISKVLFEINTVSQSYSSSKEVSIQELENHLVDIDEVLGSVNEVNSLLKGLESTGYKIFDAVRYGLTSGISSSYTTDIDKTVEKLVSKVLIYKNNLTKRITELKKKFQEQQSEQEPNQQVSNQQQTPNEQKTPSDDISDLTFVN